MSEPEVRLDTEKDSEAGKDAGARTQTSSMLSLKDWMDLFGKLIFGLAGLCYILGVIVVAIHLRRYGVGSLDLPQLHYVTAGVWVVLPVAAILTLLLFGIFLAATRAEVEAEPGPRRKWVDRISLILGIIIALIFVTQFFWSKTGIEFSWTNIVWIPLFGLFATFILAIGAVQLKGISSRSAGDFVRFLGTLILGLILFAAYVLLFATHTYQAIPWATGGGRASQVRLIMPPESKPYVEALKVPLAVVPKSELVETDSIKLLLTTEKQLVIINTENQAVNLPADLVKGITYEK